MSEAGAPTLTVACHSGTANRLRVLLCGAAIATATDRRFQMVWPANDACGARFGQLFTAPWTVLDADPNPRRRHSWLASRRDGRADILRSMEPDLYRLESGSLLAPDRYPHHAAVAADADRLIGEVVPIPDLQTRIDAFVSSRFRPVMIGVHVRRGDFVRRHPDLVGNLAPTLSHVDALLARSPSAGIFLATDDGAPDQVTGRCTCEGVRERFAGRYGDRVAWIEPRSLDRRESVAVADAVVDLWLLRRTQSVVGSAGSSYSELAVLGREVELRIAAAPTAGYARLERWARATGVHQVLRSLPFGPRADASLAASWSHYTGLSRAALRRIRRSRSRRV